MLALVLIAPAIAGTLAILLRSRIVGRSLLIGTSVLYLTAAAVWIGNNSAPVPAAVSAYFAVDGIGRLFFAIMAVVFAASAVYSLAYLRGHPMAPRQEGLYSGMMILFADAMAGVLTSNHLALLWVFVEATTLTSAVLIYTERSKASLEAAWKYIFICSVGIALAFVGIILITIGSGSIGTLSLTVLYRRSAEINPFWLKLAFAFILIGFGTKTGLAPVHAWLPDAHSEAPSPVSAILSGALLNTAFLGLVRVNEILIRAHLALFSNTLLRIVGFLSLFIAAVYMFSARNYKRMLAYSSIENMGILCIGVTLGPAGMFAAMIQAAAQSFAKASLFLTSGTILSRYGTRRIDGVRGLLRADAATGWLWLISLFAAMGLPPFPTFLGKFLIVRAFFESGAGWMAAPFLLVIVLVIAGMAKVGFSMLFGDAPPIVHEHRDAAAYVPQILLVLLLVSLGVTLPNWALAAFHAATGFAG